MYPATPSWARQPQVLAELKLANTGLGEFTRGNYRGERQVGRSLHVLLGGGSLFFLGVKDFSSDAVLFSCMLPWIG